jgi:tetratricopeptide (TPR) repeat protein
MLVCILARSLGFKKVDPWWADMNSIRQHQKSIPPDVPSHIFPLVHLSNQEVIIADGALCSNLDFTHVSKPFKLEDAYEPEPVGKCLRLKNPNNPALFHGRIRETKDLAMLWNNRGLRDSNPESLTNALAYDPDLADAHVNLAEHLRKSGDLSQAMSHFKRAIDIDPKCVPAGYYCMLAEFYSNSNRWDDALAIMTNATMLNLQDPLFRYCRATVFGSRGLFYLKSGKWKEAIEDLTKEADLNPNGRAYCDLTYAHAKLREWHKARDTSIKAIALDPAFAAKSFALLKEELLKDASDTSTTTVELRSAITNLVHHIDGKLKASQK